MARGHPSCLCVALCSLFVGSIAAPSLVIGYRAGEAAAVERDEEGKRPSERYNLDVGPMYHLPPYSEPEFSHQGGRLG